MTKLHKSFSSLAAEFLIVIVGILMAISIDAWWSERGDRRDEQVLLRSLSEEFEQNERALATQFEPYERRLASAETLLRLGPEATDISADSLTSLWRWITRGGSYDPSTGVLDAAMSSGDITLIRDPALRAILAGWSSSVDDLTDVEDIVNDPDRRVPGEPRVVDAFLGEHGRHTAPLDPGRAQRRSRWKLLTSHRPVLLPPGGRPSVPDPLLQHLEEVLDEDEAAIRGDGGAHE